MSILESADGLDQALRTAFGFDTAVVVEEFIAGRELTVGILNDEPLPVIEIVPKSRFFDFQAKYQAGCTEYIVPAKISGAEAVSVQEAALTAHRSLVCFGCSRVDVILRGDGVPFVLELNNIPGMTETSLLPKAARVKGIDFTQLCVILLRCAYEKKTKNSG
jgi:D-alanine-D-alanine ligase